MHGGFLPIVFGLEYLVILRKIDSFHPLGIRNCLYESLVIFQSRSFSLRIMDIVAYFHPLFSRCYFAERDWTLSPAASIKTFPTRRPAWKSSSAGSTLLFVFLETKTTPGTFLFLRASSDAWFQREHSWRILVDS